MSTISSALLERNAINDTPARGLRRTVKGWWIAYMNWRLEQLAISQLQSMSNRELKDMGVSRSQIEFAVKAGADLHPLFSRYY